MNVRYILILISLFFSLISYSQKKGRNYLLRETNPDFFLSADAQRIGDQLILFQRNTGGWPKNVDMIHELSDAERADILSDKERLDDSTIDNGATTTQLVYLARLYQATNIERYKLAFLRAVKYLLDGQYANGGLLLKELRMPNFKDYKENYEFID